MDVITKPLKLLIIFVFLGITVFEIPEAVALNKNKVKVTFRSQYYETSKIDHLKLNHPIRIPREEIFNHLVSLKYRGTFIGNKEEPVFNASEIKTLTLILFKAFAMVTPEKIIRIQLESAGGITSGDIFSFKNYLNWRFDSIHGETFLQKNNIRGWNIFSWEMMLKKGQLYFRTGVDKRIQKNWIISKLMIPVSEKENTITSKPLDTINKKNFKNNINPKLEEKLEHLMYLYKKKLINEEEYKNQQKKIFDELF